MSMCKIQTTESPRSPKMRPNLYWMGNYEVHACTYVGIVWLVIFVGANLLNSPKSGFQKFFSWLFNLCDQWFWKPNFAYQLYHVLATCSLMAKAEWHVYSIVHRGMAISTFRSGLKQKSDVYFTFANRLIIACLIFTVKPPITDLPRSRQLASFPVLHHSYRYLQYE